MSPPSRRVIKVLMKTSMNIYPFAAPSLPKLSDDEGRCSFLSTGKVKPSRSTELDQGIMTEQGSMRRTYCSIESYDFRIGAGQRRIVRKKEALNWKACWNLHSNASLLSIVDRRVFIKV